MMNGAKIVSAEQENVKGGGIPHRPHSHRRPSVPISAPAQTRHFLFRIPEEINPRWVDEDKKRSALWALLLTRINYAIKNLAHRLGGRTDKRLWIKAITPKPSSNDLIASESNSIDVIFSGESSARIRIRVAVFLECFSISVIWDKLESGDGIAKTIENCLNSEDPNAGLSDLYLDKKISIRDILSELLIKDVRGDVIRNLYDGNSEYERTMKELADVYPDASGVQSLLSVPYAAFNGVIIHTNMFKNAEETLEFDKWTAVQPKLASGICKALSSNFKLFETFLSNSWQNYDPAIAPDVETPKPAPDGILCGMLSGHALYASALAMTSDTRNQVNYMVVYDRDSEDQLGRLIHRLHVLGELRLCALMDFDAEGRWGNENSCQTGEPANLNQAGQLIHKIDKDITDFRAESSNIKTIHNAESESLELTYKSKLVEFAERFNKLDRCAVGGLSFRIERSRYYAASFRNQVKDLRIVRIEGWQPYHEFVRRYLFQIFDGIQSIGRRYEALGRKIDRLRADAQVAQIASLLRKAELVGYIAANYYGFSILYKIEAPYEFMHCIAIWFSAGLLIFTIVRWLLAEWRANAYRKRDADRRR